VSSSTVWTHAAYKRYYLRRTTLEAEKVGLLEWSPLAGGLLSGKYGRTQLKLTDSRRTSYDFPVVDKGRAWKILDVMAPLAEAHGCSLHGSRSHGSWQSLW